MSPYHTTRNFILAIPDFTVYRRKLPFLLFPLLSSAYLLYYLYYLICFALPPTGMDKENTSVLYKTARLASILGHPLLTLPVFTTLLAFNLFDPSKATWVSLLIVGVIVLPVTVRNYIKTKRKEYTNFDISDQHQRQSFYPFVIALTTFVTAVLYFTPGTESFFTGTCILLVLLIASALINRVVKCSLHTSASIYLATVLWQFSVAGSIAMFAFTIIIATSRLILKRHTIVEIITGAATGFTAGIANNYFQR